MSVLKEIAAPQARKKILTISDLQAIKLFTMHWFAERVGPPAASQLTDSYEPASGGPTHHYRRPPPAAGPPPAAQLTNSPTHHYRNH